jgi:hypothetical protein
MKPGFNIRCDYCGSLYTAHAAESTARNPVGVVIVGYVEYCPTCLHTRPRELPWRTQRIIDLERQLSDCERDRNEAE